MVGRTIAMRKSRLLQATDERLCDGGRSGKRYTANDNQSNALVAPKNVLEIEHDKIKLKRDKTTRRRRVNS